MDRRLRRHDAAEAHVGVLLVLVARRGRGTLRRRAVDELGEAALLPAQLLLDGAQADHELRGVRRLRVRVRRRGRGRRGRGVGRQAARVVHFALQLLVGLGEIQGELVHSVSQHGHLAHRPRNATTEEEREDADGDEPRHGR